MAKSKTKQTAASVNDFLDAIDDEQLRTDSWAAAKVMQEATKDKGRMVGGSIVGFGKFMLKYANGKEQPWILTGLAPRKDRITMYVWSDFDGHDALMAKLGKYKAGQSCIHIKRLSDIHLPTLKKLIKESIKSRSGK